MLLTIETTNETMQYLKTTLSKRLSKKFFNSKLPRLLIFMLLFSGVCWFAAPHSFAISSQLAHQQQFEGKLEILHMDDFKGNGSTTSYTLINKSGVRTPVDLHSGELEYRGAAKVQLKGSVKNGRIQVMSPQDAKLEQATLPTTTPHKTAVVLYNFNDNTSQPISPNEVNGKAFTNANSASAFFKEESYGQRGLVGIQNPTGDVFGYYTISATSNTCDYYTWANQVNAAALAAGHDLSNYDNVIYIAGTSSCEPYGGLGQVGGKDSWLFIDSRYPTQYAQPIIEHEVTHNFGTWHANAYNCVDANSKPMPISDNCTYTEYGDQFDIMGWNIYYGHTYHSNNYFLHDLNFVPNTTTITTSGDYLVTPIETATASSQATARLVRSVDQYNNTQYYYLEYRQPFGFDDFSAADPAVNGAMIRISSGSDGYIMSGLINVHAGNPTKSANPVMQDGDVFTDAAHNIKITQLSHSAAGVRLHIDLSPIPPADTTPPTAPTNLSVTPASATQVSLSWTPATDNVGVTTNYVVRNGVTIATLGNVSGYVDTTASPATTYTYSIYAADAAGNKGPVSTAVSVTTPPLPDTTPPTTPTGLTASLSWVGNNIQANLLWNAATDNVGVTGYTIYRNGSILSTTTNTSYVDAALGPSQTYTYMIVASDAAGNHSSQSVAANVTTPPAQTTLTGSVTSSFGFTLYGASVQLSSANKTFSTITDRYGHYTFNNVANGTYTLTVSKRPYRTTSQTVTLRGGRSIANVVLQF